MSGIAHLQKDQRTRPSRIDSLDADGVNSIIGRITGANPSPVTEGAAREQAAQSSQVGAPPSPIMQNFQQPHGGGDLQQMQQRMQMLEQKVAHYESGTAAADKLVRQGKEDQSNRSGSADSGGGTYAPNMNTKAAAKKIMKKDVADGEPDGPKAQPGGQPMAASRTNILGISMNEWNDLIGVTSPYANPVEAQSNLSESREGEEYEEFVESYFTEDELAEAWFGFIEDKGYDPDEFADFAEAAEEYGDEVALLAIQDLEDEFQEEVESFLEADKETMDQYLRRGGKVKKVKPGYAANARLDRYTAQGGDAENYRTSYRGKGGDSSQFGGGGTRKRKKAAAESVELTQEEVDFMMELWLEDRGLSAEMFHFMIDEAVATEDEDELDNLMAVEDLFYEYLDSVLEGESVHAVRMKLRGMGSGEYKPGDLPGAKPSASFLAKTRKQGAAQKDQKPGQGNLKTAANEAADDKVTLPRMHLRGGKKKSFDRSLPVEPSAKKGSPKPSGTGGSKRKGGIPPLHAKYGMTSSKEEETPDMAAVLQRRRESGSNQLPKKVRGAVSLQNTLGRRKASGSEQLPAHLRQKVQKAGGSFKAESRRGFPAWSMFNESGSINFECDCDDSGGPAIDWERLTKSYEKRSKSRK